MNFKILHQRALLLTKNIRALECELIELLQKIDACRGFTELGFTSLHAYAVRALGLSDEVAFKLIRIERKSVEVPELKRAIASGEISVSKATVVASVINRENKEEWLALARSSSKQQLEKAVAETHPEMPKPEKVRHQGNNQARLDLSVREETLTLLRRAQELLAQKSGAPLNLSEVLHALAENFVKREDPVAKADRNAGKTVLKDSNKLHKVHHRDRGSCQFKFPGGAICGQKIWLHIHHIKPRSEGGTDDPENLVTLCSAHHRLIHAQGMPLH